MSRSCSRRSTRSCPLQPRIETPSATRVDAMIRLFTAIEIPETIRVRLSLLQGGVPGARWTPIENLHLTLRFIGEVDERTATDIDDVLNDLRAPAFELALK